LNCDASSLPFGLLQSRAGLERIEREPGIDWVLFRPGKDVAVRLEKAQIVLDAKVDLGNGHKATLSDHSAVLAVLELTRETNPPVAKLPRSDLELVATAKLALGIVFLTCAARVASLARRRTRRRALVAFAVALITSSIICLALGLAYEP